MKPLAQNVLQRRLADPSWRRYCQSAQRRTVELLTAEIGQRDPAAGGREEKPLQDREAYSVAAGFAFGLVCLGLTDPPQPTSGERERRRDDKCAYAPLSGTE